MHHHTVGTSSQATARSVFRDSLVNRLFRGTAGIILCVVVVVFALDQITKEIMVRAIGPDASRSTIELVPGVLDFRFVRNTGSAFGLFQGQSAIISVLAIGAISFLALYYLRHGRNDWLIALAIGLQIGGALGNVVDRFRYGYVVDFIDFPRFPTFNVADSAITLGVTLLMYALLFRDFRDQESIAERTLPSHGDES
jgi:signal peptidase II